MSGSNDQGPGKPGGRVRQGTMFGIGQGKSEGGTGPKQNPNKTGDTLQGMPSAPPPEGEGQRDGMPPPEPPIAAPGLPQGIFSKDQSPTVPPPEHANTDEMDDRPTTEHFVDPKISDRSTDELMDLDLSAMDRPTDPPVPSLSIPIDVDDDFADAVDMPTPDLSSVEDGWQTSPPPAGSGLSKDTLLDGGFPQNRGPVTKPPSVPPLVDLDRPDALDLVGRNRKSSAQRLDLGSEMKECFALDDFTGALRAAELLLGRDPEDAEANAIAIQSRDRLSQMYLSRVGSISSVPVVVVPDAEIRWLGLDHRAGFLLSRIDGNATVEELIDVSGMERIEALKILAELVESSAVRIQ